MYANILGHDKCREVLLGYDTYFNSFVSAISLAGKKLLKKPRVLWELTPSARLTPSSGTAADSRWTGGGTPAWWAAWASTQRCSSSACPLPGGRRASPASGTERSEERSTEKDDALLRKKHLKMLNAHNANIGNTCRMTSITFPSKVIFLLRWISSSILFIDCTLELHSLMI